MLNLPAILLPIPVIWMHSEAGVCSTNEQNLAVRVN